MLTGSANKNEEQSDYLQSLFSKPFCQRFYLDNHSQTHCPKPQQVHKHRHHYHNIIAETNQIFMRKSHIDNRDKNAEQVPKCKDKLTPYLNRKRQEREFSQQLKKSMDRKQRQTAVKLETTQKQWLIIKQVQANSKKNQKGNHRFSTLQLANASTDQQTKKNSANKLIRCEPFSEGQRREQAKNIKSMMSYYKNKRAIKQMAKFGDANNLTNFQIEESINLRIEIKSNSKFDSGEDSDPFKNLSLSRKTNKRERHNKTETCTSEKTRVKIVKSINMKDAAPHSIFLKGILSSNKIGISSFKHRPKTEMRPHRSSHHKNLPKNVENRLNQKNFDLTGWESSFMQDSAQL